MDDTRTLHPCLCGCGELVAGTWKRGHAARGPDPDLLPGPDEFPEVDDGDDPDEIDADEDEPEDRSSGPRRVPRLEPESPLEPAEITADPSPGKVGKGKPRRSSTKPPKVTVATRTDIAAKMELLLQMGGGIWAVRDPYCGGTFVQQIPPIRNASVDLILQSPDLVAWFTGVGGGFMLALNLLVALQPVGAAVWNHHVAHSVEEIEHEPSPARQYAA